jgi:hypothetical protein
MDMGIDSDVDGPVVGTGKSGANLLQATVSETVVNGIKKASFKLEIINGENDIQFTLNFLWSYSRKPQGN